MRNFTPEINMICKDMYMGGCGELEHIGRRGRIVDVDEIGFTVTCIDGYGEVDDVFVEKDSYENAMEYFYSCDSGSCTD